MRAAVAIAVVLAGCDLVFPPGKGGGDAAIGDGDGPTGGDSHLPDPDAQPTTDAAACSTFTPPCTSDLYILTCGGSCFALCLDARGWDAAEGVCNVASTHLAGIPDTVANDCVDQVLTMAGVATAWVGLRQNDGATFPITGWHWIDGTLYTGFGWDTGSSQPDDGDGSEDQIEQCGYAGTAGWGDFACTAPSPFVCRR